MQFLLFKARVGDGIHGMFSKKKATNLERFFRRFDEKSIYKLHRLRHKIEADPANPQLLQTSAGSGYKLVVE